MSTHKIAISNNYSSTKWIDTNASPEASVTKTTLSDSSTVINSIFIDNTDNAKVYLRMYNLTAANTEPGVSAPFMIVSCDANSTIEYVFEPGVTFGTGVVYTVGTHPGVTNTTGANAANIRVEVLIQ